MSEIERLQQSLSAATLVARLWARNDEQRRILRASGYAEYDKPGNRFKRFWKRLFGLYYISREDWCDLVDAIVGGSSPRVE